MLSASQKPEKTESVIERRIGDEVILVPMRTSEEGRDSIYTLNSVGRQVWALIDGERTVDEISKEIARGYGIAEEEARADVGAFLEQLLSVDFVKINPHP